jgi:hypothetical protein
MIERDRINKRVVTMFEEHGIAYRSNVVEPGGRIPLHVHGKPHAAAVHGRFRLTLVSPTGEITTRQAYNRESIEAGWQHEFVYLDDAGVGEVLCFCPADRGF